MSIKIENVNIVGVSEIIGFRRSFNSQSKSDSSVVFDTQTFPDGGYTTIESVKLGTKDLERIAKLVENGDSHAKTNRMIQVYHDLTLPRRVWVDFDTYRIGRKDGIYPDDIEYMSDSTMHTIHRGFVNKEDFSENTDSRIIDIINEKITIYKDREFLKFSKDILDMWFLEIKDAIGEGFLQTRRVMINYQALRHIKLDRSTHRQPEFREYCKWISSLPYSKQLIG